MTQTVKLEFTVEELNVVLTGLGELPLKVSNNVAMKIHKEASEQLQMQPTNENQE